MLFRIQQERFDACEAELLQVLRLGRSDRRNEVASQGLGSAVEFSLCDALEQVEGPGYWCDGVVVDRLDIDGQTGAVWAKAWLCHDRDQWLVPVRVRFSAAEERLASFSVDLGDRSVGSLDAHTHSRAVGRFPAEWLLSFEIEASKNAD